MERPEYCTDEMLQILDEMKQEGRQGILYQFRELYQRELSPKQAYEVVSYWFMLRHPELQATA